MLYCNNCGYFYEHIDGLSIALPEGNEFYVFVYFRTDAQANINGNWVDAKGRCILYSPGMPQFYRSAATPYVNDWLHISCDDDGGFFKKTGIQENILLDVGDADFFTAGIKNILDLKQRGNRWSREVENNELENIFYRISSLLALDNEEYLHQRYLPQLTKVRNELYSSPKAGTKIVDIADKSGLSPSYFQFLYKNAFGINVGEDIVGGRIARACFLLENSLYSISDIAFMSGYTCEEHFMRQFKKQTGKTAGEYRKSFNYERT